MNRTALTLLALAIGSASDPTELSAQSRPPEDEPLWVGVLDRSGHLVPIARFRPGPPGTGEGAWDEPWPELFDFEALRFDRQTGAPLIVDIPRWRPDQDTRSGWRRTQAAPVRWYIHSPGEPVAPVDATSLTITQAHCNMAWKLQVEEAPDLGRLPSPAGDRRERFIGAVFSRVADAAVEETDIPALEEIRRELGMVDRTEEERRRIGVYTGGDYTWFGFHRFGDLVVGVAYGAFYEGESYFIVEIDGDRGRIAADVHGGGC